ncbi:metallophosphoesterase family protein [Microbulbifer aggregans]|uniref:metallophosphoesterase family protein n=1 Tax=Microbulbifer aggregans TaxID=1769779 RepID=UPI001CFE411D|nr:metallophosphoesterase [Microbulbifer aggregans]
MKLVILHLSDIHIKSAADPILNKHNEISRTLYQHINDSSHLVIVITGDIAHSGQSQQYAEAILFLEKIKKEVTDERDIKVDFVTCPGNHDCDFTPNPTRDIILKSLGNEDLSTIDSSVFENCTSHQASYFSFKDHTDQKIIEEDRLWWTQEIEIGNEKIIFESINLSWSSRLREQQGKLSFPFASYEAKAQRAADYRIALMHHPLNWLDQPSYRQLRSHLRSTSSFIFTGHEHNGNAANYDDIESGHTILIEGGALQEKTLKNSTFGVMTICLNSKKSSYQQYEYCKNQESYLPKTIKNFISPTLHPKELTFSESHIEKIQDCGAQFRHHNIANLKLSDIYVYPNLKDQSDQSSKPKTIPSKDLLDIEKFSQGIVISGEDNSGRTSLLNTLTNEYYDQGYLPIIIYGKDIKKNSESNLKAQLERAIFRQYKNDNAVSIFDQKSREKKILLIDNFNESKLKSDRAINESLSFFLTRFKKIIITVDDIFEVNQLTSIETNDTTEELDHFKIEQFGYRKRTELIQKWYSAGQMDHESDAEVIGKCNIAEKLMDTVMDKSLISPNPIFLLTFLQSIETGNSNQLIDSALGHYYKYLLTQSFLDAGIGPEKLSQEEDYAMHLAFFFYTKSSFVINREEFENFNDEFSRKWQKSNFEKKEQIFIKSKVLKKQNDEYEFRYSHNYYYLLGKYLSENILDDEVKKIIKNCIEHLYVRKNANTILFLAHHSSSDNILFMMKSATDKVFNESSVADFSESCSAAHELIKHAPELKYRKTSPQETQLNISERRDIAEENNPSQNMEIHEEKEPQHIDLSDKLTILFKTVEILSQIVKSNPTKFERLKKVEIIKSIFSAPLRALQSFYDFLESHPKTLLNAINRELSSRSENLPEETINKVSRLAVANIIQGVSSSFIIKIAQTINSESLMPDIPDAIKNNENIAFELIDLAISLDNHKQLNRGKISAVYKKSKSNIVAKKILDIIIMHRLYMFKTSERDMQWLQSELKYDINQQHSIGYTKANKLTRIS